MRTVLVRPNISPIACAKGFPGADPISIDPANPDENMRDGKPAVIFRDRAGRGRNPLPSQGPRETRVVLRKNDLNPAATDLNWHGRRQRLRKWRAEENRAEHTTATKPYRHDSSIPHLADASERKLFR